MTIGPDAVTHDLEIGADIDIDAVDVTTTPPYHHMLAVEAAVRAYAEKFGEEAVEAIIEAVRKDQPALTREAADVLYHLLVMLAARDVTLADVEAELARREGTSGIAEKASRGG